MQFLSAVTIFTPWLVLITGLAAATVVLKMLLSVRDTKFKTPVALLVFATLAFVSGLINILISWGPADVQKLAHDIFFILGLALIISVASKLKQSAI